MDFHLPPVGEGLFEVEVVRWLVAVGDPVRRGQALMEVLSDKATMEVPAPFEGTVTALAVAPGSKVAVGAPILSYEPGPPPAAAGAGVVRPESTLSGAVASGSPSSPSPASRAMAARPPQSNGHGSPPAAAPSPARLPPAAPSVRLLARRLGIDLTAIAGTGPHGRILLDDLAPFLARPTGSPAAPAPKPAAPALDLGVAGTAFKLVGLRRKIAERMVESKRHIPHYSYMDECDLTDLVRLREQLKESFAAAGAKLTYLAFVVKAVARALKEVPLVNATYDEAAEEVTLHDRCHVGVAVAAPAGLLVPVVRDAGAKDLLAVAREIERLSGEARAGRAKLEDLRGGTFTVTSVGNIGGLISTPIINRPEVGIAGVGKVVRRPVYDAAGALRPADVAYLSFSFDHRIVDGAVGTTFGNAVIKRLQAPATLLLPEA